MRKNIEHISLQCEKKLRSTKISIIKNDHKNDFDIVICIMRLPAEGNR